MNGNRSVKRILILAALMCFIIAAANASAGPHDQPEKTGILLVTFGSSYPEAQAAFDHIDETVKAAFPDTPVRWAYTSHIVRKKLALSGRKLDSPAEALAKMADEGFSRIAVQSLHLIPGEEFHDLVSVAQGFEQMAGSIKQVRVGLPLLAGPRDLARAADAILGIIPATRRSDEAVVFVGHGTEHPANAAYAALMWQVQLKDDHVFVGTVEGFPEKTVVLEELKRKKVERAWLMPLMSVAGDHAQNDIAGTGADSWKSAFEAAGIDCVSVLKGIAEYDCLVAIWLDHLKTAMDMMHSEAK